VAGGGEGAAGRADAARRRADGSRGDRPERADVYSVLSQPQQELGWTDGANVRIDYRWAAAVADRFRTAAAELVRLMPDVILAEGTPSVAALQGATQTIPIVFVGVNDPIGSGFAQSLARPGGNITGFTNYEFSMGGKWLGLLRDAAPGVKRVGVMFNPTTAPYARTYLPPLETAARTFGIALTTMLVQDTAAIDRTITEFARQSNGGLLLLPDSYMLTHRERIVALAARHRLPAISGAEPFVRAGGLMSYGAYAIEASRNAASYVDRILKGDKPLDLPVQAPTKFKLIVNLKTAKALELTVSETFLLLADEVIE
jgi:putative tryptophan/tyrosine transport system substrate-binding protein